MKLVPTRLKGAYIVELEPIADARGFFARVFTPHEFKALGLDTRIAQIAIAQNKKKATLRGMHYQVSPYRENKLVRCTRGAIFEVIIDLRRKSRTLGQWFGCELTADNRRMLYVPEGFAHGYITLADQTEVLYQMSRPHSPAHYRGVRWNDPAFGIRWPLKPKVMASRDASYGDFRPAIQP